MPKIFLMKNSIHILSLMTLLIPLFMGVLSWVTWKKHDEVEFKHLTEFWTSLAVNALFLTFFAEYLTRVKGLLMLGWIWPLRTIPLILEDVSGVKLLERWYYIAIGVAAFLSFAIGGYGSPFLYYSLPLSLVSGCLGLYLTWRTFKKTSGSIQSPLHEAMYFFTAIFFLLRLSFPFWGVHPVFSEYGPALELLVYVGLASTGMSTYMELFKGKREGELEEMLKERSEKFYGHSKFSELGMMSAGIAHEINNPLAVIQARTTQLLRVYNKPERQKEVGDGLQQILQTSERINKTIQGVREFVHQDERVPLTDVSLKELFDNVLAFTGQRMKNHGISLRFYGLEKLSLTCRKIQIEQVILNLLNNSFDAIEYLPNKWIEVSCHEKDGKIQIYFKDSGKGIPTEISNRMMEPFFSTKEIGKGTGLGLALARGIVEKHGGTLTYLPDCPHTTFLLELPKTQSHEWGLPLH